MEHYAIYSVDCYSDTSDEQIDRMKPKAGEWTLTEGDEQYEYDYLADEIGSRDPLSAERFRNGKHRKWVALLSDDERTALTEEMFIEDEEGEPTLGMITEYGHLPAVAHHFDGMDWNLGGVTHVIDALLYITPTLEQAEVA